MHFDILSLFPEYFSGPFAVSILKRAQEKGIISIHLLDMRTFAKGKHRKVDERPYGGGPGMVLMPEPVTDAIRSVKREGSHTIYLSPQGKRLDAKKCKELASYEHLILLCGHYEGIDERIIQKEVDEEISIGDYVLSNGCLPAIVLVDAIARFIPGVLGNEEASSSDSFQEGILEAPQYTKPVIFEELEVPSVLLSGNHAEISKWRHAQAVEKTKKVRPDLIRNES